MLYTPDETTIVGNIRCFACPEHDEWKPIKYLIHKSKHKLHLFFAVSGRSTADPIVPCQSADPRLSGNLRPKSMNQNRQRKG